MPHKILTQTLLCAIGLQWVMATVAQTTEAPKSQNTPSQQTQTHVIPWSDIGAKGGADYQGQGLSVAATPAGARLHCLFQRLDGEATAEGLWLVSTLTNHADARFRVVATALGWQALPARGTVTVTGQTVRFARAGLVEEYSVSMDGVRQDFVVTQKPSSDGTLIVRLAASGARVEPTTYGAQLVLDKSGRKIAYSRLRATDANGKELPARIQAEQDSEVTLAVVVNDAGAVYPVRIDPTFSDADWISMDAVAGVNGDVYATAVDDAGNLYIGGNLTTAPGNVATEIAEWNGSSWSLLGSGVGGGLSSGVFALAVSGGTVFAGGRFTTAGGNPATNIAQWNGSSWSPLGSGVGGDVGGLGPSVDALVVSGLTLYVGGAFNTAGGNAANYIAQWNGSTWSPLGSGLDGEVFAMAVSGDTLYAGGFFNTADGNAVNHVAQWNGNSWSPLGSGLVGPLYDTFVYALAVSGGTLYAGGNFTNAGGNAANNIAQWNGNSWSSLGSGTGGDENALVQALAVSGTNLYAGGYFTTAGGNAAINIAQWNGSSWSPLGSGLAGPPGLKAYVDALAVWGGTFYAGGAFTTACGNAATNIAQWNGSHWSPQKSGVGGDVYALAVSGDTVYAGGDFTTAGGNAANYIVQWNGSGWSPLGSGMDGIVYALAVSSNTLYAGGDFGMAGGSTALFIAQWNGSNWSSLGGQLPYVFTFGMDAPVLALAVSGGTLYAGGDFTLAGGNAASYVAQWDGSSWSPLGAGMNNYVQALAVSGTNLYAGGNFTNAGGNAANYIGQWNGSSWSPLGSGMNNNVDALAVSGTNLYAGGDFTSSGDGLTALNFIGQWNGSSWSPLGSGMNGNVYALAGSGGMLFAGGNFTNAGGNAANYIAQWNGSNWLPLGSGVGGDNPFVNALAVSSFTLYVGGQFATAGGTVSENAAEAVIGSPLSIVTTGSPFGFISGQFQFTVTGPAGSNAVVQASTNLQTWIPLVTNPLTLGSFTFSDMLATNYPARFYRAQLSQ